MFKDLFVQLLQERNITAYKLSKDTGLSEALISNWKSGRQLPKYDSIKILCDYFEVSADYLLGRTETSKTNKINFKLGVKNDMQHEQLASIIEQRCKSLNVPISQLIDDCGLTENFISNLRNQTTFPSEYELKDIAKHLDCSVEYLLGQTPDPDMYKTVTINMNIHSKEELEKLYSEGYDLVYMTFWEGHPDTVSITMKKKNLKTAEPAPELPEDEQSLLDSYRTLDTYDKGEISGTIKQMLRADKYSNQDESYLA